MKKKTQVCCCNSHSGKLGGMWSKGKMQVGQAGVPEQVCYSSEEERSFWLSDMAYHWAICEFGLKLLTDISV